MIRPVSLLDAVAICDIYNYYVSNTIITFEEDTVSVKEMEARISNTTEKYPWLVYELNGLVIGYAYATEWKTRRSYRFSAESTIYLRQGSTNKGIGSALYQALLDELNKMDLHAVIGGIALPNDSSVTLHKNLGFEKVAHFKETGYKFDTWIDVAYWEKILVGKGK